MAFFLEISFPDLARGLWPVALPVLIGMATICLLLPRPRGVPGLTGAVLAGAALLAALWFLIRGGGLDPETVLFYAFASVAITAGGLLVTQRNPARGALSFALVVLSTCGLFLLQAAPFLMAATVIVYAGAIIVTFLFVLMLAQQAGGSNADHRSREPLLSSAAGFVLLGAILYTLNLGRAEAETAATHKVDDLNRPMLAPMNLHQFDALLATVRKAKEQDGFDAMHKALGLDFTLQMQDVLKTARGAAGAKELGKLVAEVQQHQRSLQPDGATFKKLLDNVDERGRVLRAAWDQSGRATLPADNVAHLGHLLFTDYLLAVEMGGTLLLVAAVGAIAIANRRGEGTR